MSLPISEAHQRASYPRSGMLHQAATQAEIDGANANVQGKATQRASVFGHIVSAGSEGLTSSEIHELTTIPRHVLSARLRELENDSLIFKNGERRLASTGVRQNCYQAAPSEGRLL